MFRKVLPLVVALALPGLLVAQSEIPNAHASDTAKAKVAAHRQNPAKGPADEASDTAKAKVAEHRATQVRGKTNDIVGAATGNTGRQMKGKLQKAAGKLQSALGRGTRRSAQTRS